MPPAVSDGRDLAGSADHVHGAFFQSKKTIYVDDDNTTGPWDGTLAHPYQYIQDAIDAAAPYDNIYVLSGTYYEQISVDKPLHLVGEEKSTTIIDGSEAGDVVTINADYVNITGFTVQRSGMSSTDKGINVRSNYNTIIDNIILNNRYGIHIHADGTHDNSITHNAITNNGKGIFLRISQNNGIFCNNFENNSEYGIILSLDAYNNHIYHNNFIDNAQNAREVYDNESLWDDGYPSGGNYWSDFDEPSEGAYDDNGDGIVDSSYQIPDGFNQDAYPFIDAYDYPLHANANGPYGGLANEAVEFLGDAYGGTKPYTWYWQFGDGDTSNGQNPSHSYTSIGEYTAILTVTDSIGSAAEDSATVFIRPLRVWVDDDFDASTPGWGIDHFDNINDGVYAAAFAGTVYVFNGTYDERVAVDKLLHLVGENRDSTIVSGTGTGYVVRVSANDVSIRDFTVTNGGWGIHLYRIDNAEVDSCILRDNLAGVYIDWSDSNTIVNCNIYNNTNGVYLGSDQSNIGNEIINNRIHHNNEFGIYFDHNYQKSNIVHNNVIAYNGYNGIWMVTAWENEISHNQFFYNDLHAICILQCMCGGQDNIIHHNDFVLNNGGSIQAYDYLENGQNYWYSQADDEGNYWSDFENNPGYPYYYEIEGSGSIDLYPLLDTQPPEAIDDLAIFLESGTKSAAGDMRLIWTEPEDDLVVARYVIYRSTDAGSIGDSLAGSTDTTYLDVGAAGDVGTDYFYTVKAVDASGNKSERSNQVGEFDRSLIGDE